MKKDEKMRKKIAGFMIAGMLVLILGFTSTPARAELSLGVVGGYYSPNFGWINDYYFDSFNDWRGTYFKFKPAMMYSLALGYDVTPHFRLRLEYTSFKSETSDDFWDYSALPWATYYDSDFKLTVTPVILSGTYRFSPFYIGGGVGSFSTEFKDAYVYEDYLDETSIKRGSRSYSANDTPLGVLFLGGFEYSGQGFSGTLEARYVVAEADLTDWLQDAKADLGGFQVCAGILVPLWTRKSG